MREEIDKIVCRRFGSQHDKPCASPTMLTCAMWECQVRDRCIHLPLMEIVKNDLKPKTPTI